MFRRIPAYLLCVLLVSACSEDSTGPGDITPIAPETVNDFVQSVPDWEVPDDTEEDPQLVSEDEDFDGSAYVRCEQVEYDRKQNFDNLVAVGANDTALKPGMMVQGKGVRSGAISSIGLARSPILLSVNLALEDPSREVTDPNSATIQDAIASLQREADTRLGNLDVVPAQISFSAREVHSYAQAMLDAGMSVKYNGLITNGSVGVSLNQNSSSSQHSVLVKIFQPMYTISFADDAKAEPADFFADTVTEADFQRQIQLRTMGPDNPPCYVQSVSYGVLVMYSATSSEAESASELRAALQASYGLWEGSANMTQRQRELVQNSSYEVQVFGGTQSDRTEAIKTALRSGDYSEFLTPTPSTTAVPLSFRINDLKNRQAAVIGDATKYTIQTCETFHDFRFTVSLDSVVVVNGCVDEQSFDIETGVTSDGDWYWLKHITNGQRFTREDLANGGETAIFEMNATADSYLEFYIADFGNGTTGRSGWSKTKTFDFPFNFESNPFTFSIFDTTTDSDFHNCTIEAHYSVKRELINIE